MKRIFLAAALITVTPMTALAQNDVSPVPASVDQEVSTFLEQLRAGKPNDAVATILSSPLWAQKPGAREASKGQIDAAIRAYGPAVSYEKIATVRLGTMAVREYYLVQHRDMVVRWEFELVRTGNGWHTAYFGFTDQPNTWF